LGYRPKNEVIVGLSAQKRGLSWVIGPKTGYLFLFSSQMVHSPNGTFAKWFIRQMAHTPGGLVFLVSGFAILAIHEDYIAMTKRWKTTNPKYICKNMLQLK
jgi:hypothetical protein